MQSSYDCKNSQALPNKYKGLTIVSNTVKIILFLLFSFGLYNYFLEKKVDNDNVASAPETAQNNLQNLHDSDYNALCVGVYSVEEKTDKDEIIFHRFHTPSVKSVIVSNNKKYYECSFHEESISFRVSKDGGVTYSEWMRKGKDGNEYSFRKSLSQQLVNMLIATQSGKDEIMSLDKIKSTNMAINASQVSEKEFNNICQHAISLEFRKEPHTIKVKDHYKEGYNKVIVGYIRPADNTTWNYECQINKYDNKIIWRVLPGSEINEVGRWRDGSNGFQNDDATITYKVQPDTIEIQLKYPDGSTSKSNFRRK
ncbi:hypothetical protein [Aeromonas australiensis]|uniref:hypothetical protein n=1 Tax=Aeromonas australiensis TaxID=1114880 RepID=UPI001427C007|nr:hypothetical protein [Aeromonas australiensis]